MPIEVEVEGHGILEFPDGTTDDVIQSAVRSVVGGGDSAPERTWADTALDALPVAGGALGGLLGMAAGPAGAIGGAALGGAGGEAWRQNINRLRGKDAPTSMGEAAGDIATSGAVQGATEAAGGLIGKGLQRGGRAIYRGLLKPSKALRDDFGGDAIVDTLIKEGATISRKGGEKMTGRLTASREKALEMVQDAAAAGDAAPITASEVARGLKGARKTLRLRKEIGKPDQTGAVRARVEALADTMHGKKVPVFQKVTFDQVPVERVKPPKDAPIEAYLQDILESMRAPRTELKAIPGAVQKERLGEGIDVVRAQKLKETAQDAASGAYRMAARGQAAEVGAEGLLDEGVARGLRRSIEARVPKVAAQNKRTQALIGGTRALEDALDRSANNLSVGGMRDAIAAVVGQSVAGPAGLSAGLLTRLLASPRAGSALAIGLDRTGKNVPIDELIRALQLAMNENQ